MLVLAKIINNSLIFAGRELGNLGVIEKVDRPFLPKIRLYESEIPSKSGGLFKDSLFDSLTINISIRLFNDITRNIDDIIFDLMQYVYSKEIKPLNYKNRRTWYDAILVDINSYGKYRNDYAYMELVFKVFNPLARSKDRYKISSFTDKVLDMESICPSRGVFTFTGSSNRITNVSTGEFIEIMDGASGNFTIDCEKEIILINGSKVMNRLSLYSDFFDIRNGDRIKATYPISLSYYERYLYDR